MSALPEIAPNPFINDNYLISVAPIKDYITVCKDYLVRIHDISDEKAGQILTNKIKKQGKDPVIKYYRRGDNGDKVEMYTKLSQYIKEAYTTGQCIVPSLTRYDKSEEDGGTDSLHKAFTSRNLVNRAKAKKAAARAYADKQFWEASELTNLQKTLKLINNAMSGAFASPSTIHYNPSAHYTLTSITRSVASIGNAVTEMVSGGNRMYFNLEHTLGHIISTVKFLPYKKFKQFLKNYNVYIPTADECMSMVKYSTDLYWKGDAYDKYIYNYLVKLDDVERAMVMYNNDLYHFHKYNPKLVGDVVELLGEKCSHYVAKEQQVDYWNAQPDYVVNLVTHICEDELRGLEFKAQDYVGKVTLDVVTATAWNINDVFKRHYELFNTLFAGDILPVNVAGTKEMIRRVIVLSDTDSTAGSYEHWVRNIRGEMSFDASAVGLATAVMTIVGLAVENSINVLTTNMNVGTKSQNKLKMKNEYFWKDFAIGTGTKHYFAQVNIKEGHVFEEPKLELKGSGFILSKTPLEYRTISDTMYKEILAEVTSGKKVSIRKYIDRIVKVEESIMDKALSGDWRILETGEIKDPSAYKEGKNNASYKQYTFWCDVLEPKYGKIDPPPYTAVKYSVDLDKAGLLNTFVAELEDQELKARMIKYLKDNNKKTMGTLHLPIKIVEAMGLPEEFVKVANISKIIRQNCAAMYKILDTLGFQVKEEKTLMEMGFSDRVWN